MQVVKNWIDPSSRFAYESYSYHSQYNLLPMAMLSMAYEYAAPTENLPEGAAPADVGGFVFELDNLHKMFANAGGTYVEIDTAGDHHYDATGLIRVHQKGIPPQIGPSDSLLASSSYSSPNPSPITTGVGVSWQDSVGAWRTLGEMTGIGSVTLNPILQSATNVTFDVIYAGNLPNVTGITEHYVVTPTGVQMTTTLSGYSGALRYVWPVLVNDGKTASTINVSNSVVAVSQGSGAVIFAASGATNVSVMSTNYSNHNGWARLGIAQYPGGSPITLAISKAPSGIYPTNLLAEITNNQLKLSWPTDHVGWRLQVQTNALETGLRANWFDVAGSSSTDNVTVPLSSNGGVFYRLVFP
jgi:hypothetical protein